MQEVTGSSPVSPTKTPGSSQPYGVLTALGASSADFTSTFSSPSDSTVAGSVAAAVAPGHGLAVGQAGGEGGAAEVDAELRPASAVIRQLLASFAQSLREVRIVPDLRVQCVQD